MNSTLRGAEPLADYRLKLVFSNGSIAYVALKKKVRTLRLQDLSDKDLFATAKAREDCVVWSNGEKEVSIYVGDLLDIMLA